MAIQKGIKEYTSSRQSKNGKKDQRGLISLFFETVLEIIEDKRDSNMPVATYCLLIVLYMLQIGGYIFQFNALDAMQDEKMRTLGHLSEQSTGTYFIFLKGEESFIITLFFILQVLMYTQIIYLVLVTIGKRIIPKQEMQRTIKIRSYFNRILNTYYLFYIWAFSIPNIEMNAGIASCGEEGYLTQYNGSNCSKKPVIYTLLAILGLIFTAITILILVFFFRNYEFDDTNILKRRFRMIQVFQLCFYFLTIFNYFFKVIPSYFTEISLNIIALTYLYDSIVNLPFRNERLGKFYASASIVCLFLVIIFTMWTHRVFFPDQDILYTILIISAILIGSFSQVWSFRLSQIMTINSSNFSKYQAHLDFYLEQLFRLGQSSSMNEKDKFYLFELLIYHQTNCLDEQCYCKITTFKDEKDNLVKEDLYKLIDSIFIWSLNQQIITKSMDNLEHVSLKFITYLTKYRNNSFRAYYYLKQILAKHERLSLYFKTLSNILSLKIEEEINHQAINKIRQKSNENSYTLQKKQINLVIEADLIQETILPHLISYVNAKAKYYSSLKESDSFSLEQFSILTLKISQQAITLKNLFQKIIFFNKSSNLLKKTYRISKLKQIYSCVVLNELFASVQDEIHLNELIRNDQNKHLDMISNISVLKRDVLTIKVSISKSRGELIGNNLKNAATFFGYSSQDTHKVKNLNSLMPHIFSDIHDYFINASIQRGNSKLFEQKLQTFGLDSQHLLFPINLYLSYSFDIYNDCCISGTIVKRDTTNSYILFDQFGAIIGMTDKVFKQIFKTRPSKDNFNFHSSSFPNSQSSNSFENAYHPIEQYFKAIDPTGVYNKFSIFLIVPQIIRIIRKQYKEAQIQSEYTHNKDPVSNKFSANLCVNKVYKIRIPFNYLELSNKLNQVTNHSLFQDQMRFSKNKSDKSQFDFNSFYKSISSFCKKNARFYEDSDNCYKELDMVFNLQFYEYYYEQNHQQKKRSFYCIEIHEIMKDVSDSKLNILQKITPLLNNDSDQIQTLENTIESSRMSYGKNQSINQNFDELSDEEDKQNKQQNDEKIVSELLFQQKEYNGQQPQIQKQSNIEKLQQVVRKRNSKLYSYNNKFNENQRRQSLFQVKNLLFQQNSQQKQQQQQQQIVPTIPLVDLSISENNIEQEISEGATPQNTDNISPSKMIKKKDISKQMTFEPQNTNSISDGKSDKQQNNYPKEDDIQLYEENSEINKEYQQYYFDYQYNENIKSIELKNNNNTSLSPKKYQWDAKLNNVQLQQKQSQQEDENDYEIPLEVLQMEQKNKQNITLQNTNHNNLENTFTSNQIIDNRINLDSCQNIDDQKLDYTQIQLNSNGIDKNNPFSKRSNNDSLYYQIEQHSTRNQSQLKEQQGFEQSISTARILLEQNDVSTHNMVENDHIEQDKMNQIHHFNNIQQQKHNNYTQNNPITGLQDALTQRSNTIQGNLFKGQMILQNLNQQNSSQHSLTSLLRNCNNRLIYQIHDSVYFHTIIKQLYSISVSLLILFASMILVYTIQINNKLESIQNSFDDTMWQSQINQQYYNTLQTSLILFQIDYANLKNNQQIVKKKQQLQNQLINSIQTYQDNHNDYMAQYLHNVDHQSFSVSAYIYDNMKVQETKLNSFIEFDLLTFNNILQAIKQDNTIDKKSLYYLEKNLLIFDQNQQQIQNRIFEREGENDSTIKQFNLSTFIITIVVYSIIFIWLFILINQLQSYKERILLIIARIHVSECEQHSQICQNISKSISDPAENWLSTDFITLMFFQKQIKQNEGNSPRKNKTNKTLFLQKQDDKTNSNSQKQTQQTSSSPIHKKQKKNKRNQMLSTSFTQQRLSKWKMILISIFICFTCILFFSVINLILKNFYDNFNEPVYIHQNSQQSIESIIQVKTLTEIISTYRYLQKIIPDYPELNLSDLTKLQNAKIIPLSSFVANFLNQVDNLEQYSKSETEKVNKLFTENLCFSKENGTKILNKYYIDCSLFSEEQKELFSSGISGIFNKFIQVFTQNMHLFLNTLQYNQHEEYLLAYQKSSDYYNLQIDKSNDLNSLFNAFKDIITNICSNYTSDLRIKVKLYSIIFGSVLLCLLCVLIIYTKMIIIQQLRSLTFGLTLIPQSKLQEESTIQILKQLLKS